MADWKDEAKKKLALMKKARDLYAPSASGSGARIPSSAIGGAYVVTEALPPKVDLIPVDAQFCFDLRLAYSKLINRFVAKCNDRYLQERKQMGLFDDTEGQTC